MELSSEQYNELEQASRELGIELVVLFGSQSSGQVRPDSDYDLAMYLSNQRRLKDDFDLYNQILSVLTTIFETTEDRIDLTDLRTPDYLLGYEMVRTGRLLVGNELQYLKLKAALTRAYMDADDLRRVASSLVLKKQTLLAQ